MGCGTLIWKVLEGEWNCTVPDNLKAEKHLPALRMKSFQSLCDDPGLVIKANPLVSSIATLGFVWAHALGAVAGTKGDTSTARRGQSAADRELGKVVDTNLDRVAIPLGLHVDSSTDRSTLYKFIKMFDRVGLGYDMLAQARHLPDSYGSPLVQGPVHARFSQSPREESNTIPIAPSECPRYSGGPTGARSVLRALESGFLGAKPLNFLNPNIRLCVPNVFKLQT